MRRIRIFHTGIEILSTSVQQNTTVGRVKELIAEKISVPPNEQVITFNGCFLEGARSLNDYGVAEAGSLELHLPVNRKIKFIPIRVAFSPTNVVVMPMGQDATVGDLRNEIVSQTGDAFYANAYFIFSHYVLENDRRLDEYGIEANSCVMVAGPIGPVSNRSTPPEEPLQHYDYCDDVPGLQENGKGVEKLAPREPYQVMPVVPINLHFLTDEFEPFTLAIHPSVRLVTIFEEVENRTGIPIEHQKYIISGKQVDPETIIQHLGINEGDSIYLLDSRVIYPTSRESKPTRKSSTHTHGRRQILINFRTWDQLFSIELNRDCTVQQAIKILSSYPQLKDNQMTLYYKTKALYPTRTLSDYILNDGEEIFIQLHQQDAPTRRNSSPLHSVV